MNRIDLTQPYVTCYIDHDGPMPSGAYTAIAKLTEALETANAKLSEFFEGDADA